MEKARRKIRICLICVVFAAIVVGIFYYYYELQGDMSVDEGTLVSNVYTGISKLWQ